MGQVKAGLFTPSSSISSTSSSFVPQNETSRSISTPSSSYTRRGQHPKELSFDTEYKGPIIPPSAKGRARTLVLCFDGTGDQFDNDNSNIVQLFSLLSKGDGKQQLVYYQAGIGTYTIPQIATPFASKLRRALDMALGRSMHHHIMGGYEFLMERYRTGDKICIFGFSRGAYTARALAGMIEKVGLLPAGNHQQVPFAYKMYMEDDEFGWKQSVLFKKSFSMDVDIEFVGVWDTVESIGVIPRHVPFTKSNTCVKTFRHALSLDERRVKFKANLFDRVVNAEAQNPGLEYETLSQRKKDWDKWKERFSDNVKNADINGEEGEGRSEANLDLDSEERRRKRADTFNRGSKLEEKYTDKTKKTDVLEVWFAGCHTDVGGGSVANHTRHSLARIPLRWMIRECFRMETGIQFQAERLREVGLDPHTLYPFVQPRPPPLPVEAVSFDENTYLEALGPKGKTREVRKSRLTTKSEHDAGHVCPYCPTLVSDSSTSTTCAGSSDEGDSASETWLIKPDTRTISSASSGIPPSSNSAHNQNQEQEKEDEHPINEEHEELHDALSPAFDQLSLRWWWWILELLPLVHRHEKEDGTSVKVVSINHGRPRVIARCEQEKSGIKVHRSVRMRMEAEAELLALNKKYYPRLKFYCEPTWVD